VSTYFTPIAITLNVDSFEHLDFTTRPTSSSVYTLVQGDESVIVESRPGGDWHRLAVRAAPARVRHVGYVQMELQGLDSAPAEE
jgi:hypothetical protein